MAKQNNEFGWNFDNTYARLPEGFYEKVNPTHVPAPKIAVFNDALAEDLGLAAKAFRSETGASYLAGNAIPPGAEPIAQAYAGHQFGNLAMLGDGRAVLLGEQVTPRGARFDIHLKGSGPTQFSRRGDGRAALGPMLREYIISEAMHALNIPTTRSLAVVSTGELVRRETPLPGAVLTRIAQSHIRVGTFEFAALQNEPEKLGALADYTIQRHYPELVSNPEPYLSFLLAVIERQASLIAKWMQVGFIHGVMNTDNMALSGETIDYGPCAFMDQYSIDTVFSSIDRQGRYAYGNQAPIAGWNLTRLAEALLPLISANQEEGIAKATEALGTFGTVFERNWLAGMRAKLGLKDDTIEASELIIGLLDWMQGSKADYTTTFRALSSESKLNDSNFQHGSFPEWHKRWQSHNPDLNLMRATNPAVIPRNHKVEEALTAATKGDFSHFERLVKAVQFPFEENSGNRDYHTPPPAPDESYQTFCGT